MTNRKRRAVILVPCTGVHKEITKQLWEKKTSNASDKLQTFPLMQCLKKNNYMVNAYSLNISYKLSEIAKIGAADLCFICKMRHHLGKEDGDKYAQYHAFIVLSLKRLGANIITLYSDNVCDYDDTDSDLYKNILYLSDYVIIPSTILKNYASKWTRSDTYFSIIPDPENLTEKPFKKLVNNHTCRLIWFGHNKNLQYLEEVLSSLIKKVPSKNNYLLTILASTGGLKYFKSEVEAKLPRAANWSLRYIEWDHKNQPSQFEQELADAHISLIPSDPSDPLKNGASHNRLTDSIQSGCITIASPLNSYMELAKICLLGDDFPKMLTFAIEQNHRLCDKYELLRPTIMKRFSPQKNQEAWQSFLDQFD